MVILKSQCEEVEQIRTLIRKHTREKLREEMTPPLRFFNGGGKSKRKHPKKKEAKGREAQLDSQVIDGTHLQPIKEEDVENAT